MKAKIKIGYILGAYRKEAQKQARIKVVRSRADDSMDLHFMEVNQAMDHKQWTPADTGKAEQAYVDAFKRAEKEGCDAVIPDGMLDLGVEAGRSAVRSAPRGRSPVPSGRSFSSSLSGANGDGRLLSSTAR